MGTNKSLPTKRKGGLKWYDGPKTILQGQGVVRVKDRQRLFKTVLCHLNSSLCFVGRYASIQVLTTFVKVLVKESCQVNDEVKTRKFDRPLTRYRQESDKYTKIKIFWLAVQSTQNWSCTVRAVRPVMYFNGIWRIWRNIVVKCWPVFEEIESATIVRPSKEGYYM